MSENTYTIASLMNVIKKEFRLQRVLKYFFGMIGIAIGVVFVLRSDLGNSTWDTLHFAISEALPISFGTATIIVASSVILFVLLESRQVKYLFMFVPVLLMGPIIDLFNDIIFANLTANNFIEQLVLFVSGLLLLPLGGSLLIISKYPAGVFDELMYAIMRITKSKNLVKIRVIMEVSAVLLAFIIGLSAGIGRGKIYYGTLIFAVSMGAIIKTYLKLFERIGLSEN